MFPYEMLMSTELGAVNTGNRGGGTSAYCLFICKDKMLPEVRS